jgi:hypothetical protein
VSARRSFVDDDGSVFDGLNVGGRRASRQAAHDAAGSPSTRQLLSEPSIVWDRKRRICRARACHATVRGAALVRSWLPSWKAMIGRTAASQAWMLAASVSRTGTRIVDQGTPGAMGDGYVVVRSGSLHAARRGMRRGVEWRLYEWLITC